MNDNSPEVAPATETTEALATEAPREREDIAELARAIEAVLFAAPEPQTFEALRKGLGVSAMRLDLGLEHLATDLRAGRRGIRLQRLTNQVQLVTAPEMAPELERYFGYEAGTRLSTAALETLAIIAYRQPVTRAQVEQLRGVDCSGVISTLLSRGLIAETGRLDTAGHPILFSTTLAFLRHFGLGSLGDLPPLPSGD
ncbi:MAG TPA: SMC-Scp complex subunit ScpB [Chloroflexia bacterium]|nr:SMC-Scp complex subunit ScpB [Chloroflexia bacterium]